MPTLADVVGAIDSGMGVKAVWSRSSEPVMCFGSRGDEKAKNRAHFTQARITAEKSITRPFIITIGAGAEVPKELGGRVLELVRATGVYGETRAFVRDDELYNRLSKWPVAVVVSEIYQIEAEPHLIKDLGFQGRTILHNAYDSVLRKEDELKELWESLRDTSVRRRWEVLPLPGFHDPGQVQMCGSLYPRIPRESKEGEHLWKRMRSIERDKALSQQVKQDNRERNGGVVICDGCDVADENTALFDAHHLESLGTGPRWSNAESFAVLCPTCHRWAHVKAADTLQPLPLIELRSVRGKRSPL